MHSDRPRGLAFEAQRPLGRCSPQGCSGSPGSEEERPAAGRRPWWGAGGPGSPAARVLGGCGATLVQAEAHFVAAEAPAGQEGLPRLAVPRVSSASRRVSGDFVTVSPSVQLVSSDL